MDYTHITTEQRYEISVLKRQGYGDAEIGRIIGKHKSTIGRELRRNGAGGHYGAATADKRAQDRRRAASTIRYRLTDDLRTLIDDKLRSEQWSPEEISGRLRDEGHRSVSHETIYLYIWRDKRSGGDLHTHLRQQKKRRKRYRSNDRRGLIADRVSIDERPAVVDERSRIGDWEIDTIIGAGHRGAIVTSVERASRYVVMRAVTSTKADEVTSALTAMMRPHRANVKTITADNGREFAQHKKFGRALGADVYFAHPYHSWERGTNENTNGLVRQYFPKKMSLLHVDDRQVQETEAKLNNRPRKKLGWKTPREVLDDVSLYYFPSPT